MAVAPRDIPITRDDVRGWIIGWKRTKKRSGKTLEEYIRGKVEAMDIADPMVTTAERDDFAGSEVHVVDVILADLDSYA